MKQPKRKYLSEFALSFFSRQWIMVPAHAVKSLGKMSLAELSSKSIQEQYILKNSHIYLICKRPAISFCVDSFKYVDGILSGHIKYNLHGQPIIKKFSFELPLPDDTQEVILSPYPHREIIFIDHTGNAKCSLAAGNIRWHLKYKELENLEVMYVGQAYGNDGSRTIFQRLSNHSTFQEILADINYNSPDSEIQILGFEYCPYKFVSQIDGRAKNVINDYRDIKRFRQISENPLKKHQQICLIEAALIRYFQPQYNKQYKISFPDNSHKILKSCYNLDFSGLIVEIDTEYNQFYLFSDTVEPDFHHMCQIDLFDPQERWGFFHFETEDGTSFEMPNVIKMNPK